MSAAEAIPERPAIEGGRAIRPEQRFLVFGAPAIGQEEIDAVVDCLRSRWIGTGPRVQLFEKRFAQLTGSPNAVAVSSDTAALHLSLLAMGLGPGDEVISTPMTFCATINAIVHTGATPVLADCDPRSFNILPQEIERRITPRTRAIIVVHMCGRACDMDRILAVTRPRGIRIIEDCAHAIETMHSERHAGTIGDAGCFSFYVTKNLTTAEGGMVVTRDPQIAAQVKTLALHGLSADAWRRHSDQGHRHYEVIRAGFKYNLTDLNASIGLAQLDKLAAHAARREEIWRRYDHELADLPLMLPPPPEPGTRHAKHLYCPLLITERVRISRDHLLAAMIAEGIGIGVHYLPVHLHPFYRQTYGWGPGDFPNAEFVGSRTFSIPLTGDLDDGAVDDVCRALRRILRYYQA